MRLSLSLISTITLVSLIGISALSGNRSTTQQDTPLHIANRTQSFSVIKAECGSNEFSLTLKNNSAKKITAFTISPGNGLSITEEFVFAEISDAGIGSNELFSKTYPTLASIEPQSIEIKALIFDDGTAEGEIRAVRKMRDSRLGQQIQIRRAVRELENFLAKGRGDVSEFKRNLGNALNSSDDDTLRTLTELNPARATAKHPLSADLREGLNNGQQIIMRRLAEAETNNSNDAFLELKKTYERILGRSK
jgi:hypothetical protein